MSKRRIIGLSIVALVATNALSFWAGKSMKSITIEPISVELKRGPKPSQKQIENACYLSYVSDVESDHTTKVQLVDVQGRWIDINSSYLCAVKSNHIVKRQDRMIKKPLEQTFFVLREELVIEPLSESEFKKMTESQS